MDFCCHGPTKGIRLSNRNRDLDEGCPGGCGRKRVRRDSRDLVTCGNLVCVRGLRKSGPPPDEVCPIGCGRIRAFREDGRYLLTCGESSCVNEMRARKVRGNVYGNTGGGPGRKEHPSYGAIHSRARRSMKGQPCTQADDTCAGKIEAALNPRIPIEELSVDPDTGALYYAKLDTERAYRPLCRSHHVREGNLAAGVRRDPVVARAIRVEAVRNDHRCDDMPCEVCELLFRHDQAIKLLLEGDAVLHVVPRRKGDGLPLPWTPQQERRCMLRTDESGN